MVIISTFGALSQWPLGYFSDKFDRRIILIATTFIAAGLSIFKVISSYVSIILFFIIAAFYSSMCLPMYSLAVAHINDFLKSDEIVSASSTFNILIGIGSILGPLIVANFMTLIGPNGFFVYLFIIHSILGLFGLYRMAKRAKPSDIESQYTPLPRNITAAGMELNPVTEPDKEK